jgi:hypothetical protein
MRRARTARGIVLALASSSSLALAPALALAALLLLLLLPSPAFANDRYPYTNQLVLAPSDPNLMVLRSTFGILISHDRGSTWDWVCEDAVGYGNSGRDEDPTIGVTASGALLVASQEGLGVSADTGCSWNLLYGGMNAEDLTVRPNAPHSALVVASPPVGTTVDGGDLTSAVLLETRDDGATWAPYGAPFDPYLSPSTVEVAPGDPNRVYISGHRFIFANPETVLLTSADQGQTWSRYSVPTNISYGEIDVLVGAVDPTNAGRVYLRILRTSGSRLVVTDDGGATQRTVLTTAAAMPGFALSPDGSKVYIGGDDGIRVASAKDLSFTMTSKMPVTCLAASAGVLYACSLDTDGFILGASVDDGKTFSTILHLCGVRGALQCGANASATQCVAQWPTTRAFIAPGAGPSGCPPAQDGGAEAGADATAETGQGETRATGHGGGCTCTPAGQGRTTSGRYALAGGGVCLLVTLVALRRRPGRARARSPRARPFRPTWPRRRL